MQPVNFIFAFVVVLALIGVVAWLVRRFTSNRLGTNTQRGRMPRLAVIDAAAVDGRRRLVLVRRDNIEHLLMIGGPSDIVVESNIVRAAPARDQLPQRPSGVASPEPPAPRLAPLPDAGNWSEPEPVRHESFDYAEPPLPELPPRPIRQPFPDEVRRPAASERRAPDPDRRAAEQERRVVDPMAGFALEPLGRPEPRAELRTEQPLPPRMPQRAEPMPRAEPMLRGEPLPRGEPMPRGESMMPRAPRQVDAPKPPPPRAPERPAPLPPSADQSLAEMAQRLEAALRRPVAETVAPPAVPEPPPARPAPRTEPPIVTAAPVPPPSPPPAPPPNNAFDSLEDEMASLLGRSKSSSS